MMGIVGAWQEAYRVSVPQLSGGVILRQHMAYLLEKIPTENER